jgi:hypothetical protein
VQVTSIYYYTDLDKMKHDVRTYCFIFLGLGGAALLAYTVEHFCYGYAPIFLSSFSRFLLCKVAEPWPSLLNSGALIPSAVLVQSEGAMPNGMLHLLQT